ncbi:hypothetical protein AVEN_216724-1 [Araneus ventricosus]|uniref:Uncharacterized protein n=1 Tax=Araneus ventricosus TaxID=182803 RepID=A0A4Y2QD96_ARAVE|nr:hypothetical protein AVEN_216724-1 [Araneus ventricosus]
MARTTPELASPSSNFHATPTGGRLATTYDLACNRSHTRRIFSGIEPGTLRPRSRDLALNHSGLNQRLKNGLVHLSITHDS